MEEMLHHSTSGRTARRGHGFTLVELLMVIGVMALIMALILPAFRGFGRSASMNSSVSQVRTSLSLARQWAINQNVNVQVQFAVSNTVASLPNEAWRAFRSFAIFVQTNTSGPVQGYYLKEWTTLPPGIVFTPDTSFFPQTSGHGDNLLLNGRIVTTRFPLATSVSLVPVRAVEFRPVGSVRGSNNEIYITEGVVETNGVLFLQTNGMRFSIEVQDLTGQVRVRDYNQ